MSIPNVPKDKMSIKQTENVHKHNKTRVIYWYQIYL